MTVSDKEALDLLRKQGVRIPPQPGVLTELQKLLASEDFEMRSVTKVISQDPGIVAMLFRLARSPAFARGRKFESLDQILMVVGIKQVFNLVQAAALSTALVDQKRRAFEVFWNRASEIAQLAALIADDRVSVCNVFADQAYLAGIFHECGVPVLMLRFPKYCESLKLDDVACWPNLLDEDKRLNVDHCTVGYLVARHWGLPGFVCDAILYHHEPPEERTAGASVSLVAIIQLASRYYHRMHEIANPLWDRIGQRVLYELGLTADEEIDFFEQVSEAVRL